MSTRPRPFGCCDIPVVPGELLEFERDGMVAAFRALGDPTRLEIFRLVAAQLSQICACDVGDRFNDSQPTISHHMKILAAAGLVKVSRRGIWAYYEADDRAIAALEEALSGLTSSRFAA